MSLAFDIGSVRIRRFEVGPSKTVDAAGYFAGCPAAIVEGALARYAPGASGRLVSIGYGTILIEAAGRTILIDAAATVGGPASALRDALAAIGRAPEDIDVVVCTHAHEDRVAALAEPDGDRRVPVFPKARHVMHPAELDFLRAEWRSEPAARWGQVYEGFVRPVEQAGSLETAAGGHVLAADGDTTVRLEEAPGHAPGHLVVRISDGDDNALFASDIFHHPLQILDPRICTLGDADSDLAFATRQAAVTRCRDERTIVIGAHFAGSGAGRIVGSDGAVAFKPLGEGD
jgi:glyoxylase-like metal-dependent hydrolase (beta-lactamase superfamily II)